MSTLSKIYSMLKTQEQQKIIKPLKGVTKDLFLSWFHALTVVRNICAHHSRLWNKTLGVKFEMPRKLAWFQNIPNDKTFFALSVIAYILDCIDEDLDFKGEVKTLLLKYPNTNLSAMGFVDEWEDLELWR
jgi:abortive infection bacteriophage resistance protein